MYWNYVSDYKARESRTVHHFMAFLSMKIQTFLTVTLYPRLVPYKVQTKETKSSILICTVASEADDQSNQLQPKIYGD